MDVTDTASAKVPHLFLIHPPSPTGLPVSTALSDRTVLGRCEEEGASLILEDPLVSRVHAEVRCTADGAVVVTDLSSKNGTYVDGIRVSSARLREGAVLRLGRTVMVLRALGTDVPSPLPPGLPFRGNSPAIRRVEETCRRIAASGATVLLRGETGTGKEVFARYLHDRSGRAGRFVAVNCAAVSASLFESAFFGHRKGAFTGATKDFGGHARAAAGGTLFLDEIAELPDESQAKLLRFLETGELATIGDCETSHVDVRVLAATNQDLEARLASGRFRPDLFARLSQRVVVLPPLRDRPEDVLDIALSRLPPGHSGLSDDAAEALAIHDWPFNVRELLAALDAAAADSPAGAPLSVGVLPEPIRRRVMHRASRPIGPDPDSASSPRIGESPCTGVSPVPDATDVAPSREAFESLVRECDGNVSLVARRLGKDRRQVYRWMDRYGLR